MTVFVEDSRDVMMVCANGHVVTDRLRTQPDLMGCHCHRCGAPTFFRCLTCGMEVPGAAEVGGLVTVGRRQPPGYCCTCGAAYPWTKKPPIPAGELLPAVEKLLRRLPHTVRELKLQAGARPPFRLDDERDLEYLLRAVLPLACDDVRLHGRTPSYAGHSRMDFLLMPDRIGITPKLVLAAGAEKDVEIQAREDIRYHEREREFRLLLLFVLDTQGLLAEPEHLQSILTGAGTGITWKCIIAR